MTFRQLAIGSYFRLPGVNYVCVYRKATSSCCSLNLLLQPIRPNAKVIPLSTAETAQYLAAKRELINKRKI